MVLSIAPIVRSRERRGDLGGGWSPHRIDVEATLNDAAQGFLKQVSI
jgi:hypothetical protein